MAIPESTPDRGPAPFALCTACQVGFEVPDVIWEKGYREVRCGSCNVKFDLHEGIEAARALLAGETLRDEADSDAAGQPAGDSSTTADTTADSGAGDATGTASRLPDREGFEHYLYDDLEMDQTVTDFDLFSEEAGLPEVAYFESFEGNPVAGADQAAETLLKDPPVAPGGPHQGAGIAPATDHEPTAAAATSERQRAAGPTGSDRPDDEAASPAGGLRTRVDESPPEQPLVFDYTPADEAASDTTGDADDAAEDRQPDALAAPAAAPGRTAPGGAAAGRSGGRRTLLRLAVAGGVVLLAFAGWMASVRDRPAFYNNGFWRPAVVAGCTVFGCRVPSRVDLHQLVLLQRHVYSHPDVNDALVVNVAFRNEAAFDQRYPVLVVRFSDSLGRTVARRNFRPADYLDDWQPEDVIGAGERLDINLEIDDPGESAGSFELNFRAG